MINKETIDKIFETARIEEVIGEFVNLKKSGSNFKGLSPFSNERTPSFMVSPSKQIFKDFSSGKGGNVVSFLMEHEHYTYPEALRYLAQKYNIEIEEEQQSEEQKALRTERESLFLVNDFANQYFQHCLWETPEGKDIGLSYFRERKMQDATIREFQLGYSPASGTALTDAALSESYQLEYLEKTGLTKVDGERRRDRFWGRVMFPILSHTGRVLGFGGRVLRNDVKAAKYLNSPESEIYHKSKTLYGLYQSKNALSKSDECLLVEGYTDVISLHQAGVQNVVASSGTALTREQINLIKRYTPNITILYDGDSAGIKASLRGIDLILEEGMNVRVLLFPDGEDPDSYAGKHSGAEIRQFIEENRQDFMRFKAGLLLAEAGSNPLEKSRAAREIVMSIALIPDALERDAYIRECARILQMDERVLFSELAQLRKSQSREKERDSQRQRESNPRMEVVIPAKATGSPFYEQEKKLCWLLLNYGELTISVPAEENEAGKKEEITVAEYIIAALQEEHMDMEDSFHQKITDHYTRALNEDRGILKADDFLKMEDPEILKGVADLRSEKYFLHNWQKRKIRPSSLEQKVEEDAYYSLLRFREKRISRIMEQLIGEMSDELNERQDQMETIMALNELRKAINLRLGRVV